MSFRIRVVKMGKNILKFINGKKCFQFLKPNLLNFLKKIKKENGKVNQSLLVVAAEDMFKKCMEIHNNVGKTGLNGMEVEAKRFNQI